MPDAERNENMDDIRRARLLISLLGLVGVAPLLTSPDSMAALSLLHMLMDEFKGHAYRN